MSERLANKIAIVTGGAGGIGEATVRLFHAEGATIVFPDIDEERGRLLAKALGDRAITHRMDVTRESDWVAMVAGVVARFGRIDILVNNVGASNRSQSIEAEGADEFRRLMDLNVFSVWAGMRAILPQMKRQGTGSIVNISAVDGLAGVPQMTSYVGTKFAVTGMTKAIAIEAGPAGVRVNSVHPGITGTAPVLGLSPQKRARLDDALSRQPIARMGTPDEIARAILFFASDESSFCTGAALIVDGGQLAGQYRQPVD